MADKRGMGTPTQGHTRGPGTAKCQDALNPPQRILVHIEAARTRISPDYVRENKHLRLDSDDNDSHLPESEEEEVSTEIQRQYG